MNEQLQMLVMIAVRLNEAGIPFMLSGSMAMTAYAQPRMTRDLDIVIELSVGDAPRFAALFDNDCFISSESVERAIKHQMMFNILHKKYLTKADFIIRKQEPYRLLEFKRRKRMDIQGIALDVVSLEDLILSKLDWARDSYSELQMRDVKNLMAANPELDMDYIQVWVDKLKLRDVFDKARQL